MPGRHDPILVHGRGGLRWELMSAFLLALLAVVASAFAVGDGVLYAILDCLGSLRTGLRAGWFS